MTFALVGNDVHKKKSIFSTGGFKWIISGLFHLEGHPKGVTNVYINGSTCVIVSVRMISSDVLVNTNSCKGEQYKYCLLNHKKKKNAIWQTWKLWQHAQKSRIPISEKQNQAEQGKTLFRVHNYSGSLRERLLSDIA